MLALGPRNYMLQAQRDHSERSLDSACIDVDWSNVAQLIKLAHAYTEVQDADVASTYRH